MESTKEARTWTPVVIYRLTLAGVLGLAALLAAVLVAAPASGQEGVFSDSAEAGVHREAVDSLAGLGIFADTECDTQRFCPHDPLDRWVMAVWLIRVLGDKPLGTAVAPFEDVDDSLWWSYHVDQLARRGITSGCKADPPRYCPDGSVSRGQMATFLVGAFGLERAPAAGFTDTADSVHAANIDALAAEGITSGCQTDPLRYCPDQPVTRGQMATFLRRAVGGSDRAILVALYNATGGDGWVNNDRWLTEARPDTWHGVGTDQTGRVIHLDLESNGLTGPIPSELGSLRYLRLLNLGSNVFDGRIPSTLGRLEHLTRLNLENNALSGPIPQHLGNLGVLEDLYLAHNGLSGPIPKKLSNLTNLTTLMLRGNLVTGPIPKELSRMTSLRFLLLDDNKLTGSIPPELGDLNGLETLFLNDNKLSGSIPPELGNLSKLKSLILASNNLSGRIPHQLGNLMTLWSLDLKNNMLEGRIPNSIGEISTLSTVTLSGNLLTGCIPPGLRDKYNDFDRMDLPYCGAG